MAKLPWFPFYAHDWLSSSRVRRLSGDQMAAYIWLLCEQWDAGYLPFDVIQVTPGMPKGISEAAVAFVLTQFFPPDPDTNFRRNERLESIRLEQERLADARREGASKTNAQRSAQRTLSGAPSADSQNQRQNQKEDVDEDVLRAADYYLRDTTTRTSRIGALRGLLQGMTGVPVKKEALLRGLEDMKVAGARFTALSVRGFARKAQELLEGEAGRRAAEGRSSVLRHPDANQGHSGFTEDDLE